MSAIQDTRREHRRTSLFVLASMSAPGVSVSVKIRNLSLSGALIEGGDMPGLGQPVTLWRGKLSVSGRIVWRYANKAGVRFDDQVTITNWLPAAIADQENDAGFLEPNARLPTEDQEVLSAADALDSLAFDLFDDGPIGVSLASKLQALETASQLLRKLACSTQRSRAAGR